MYSIGELTAIIRGVVSNYPVTKAILVGSYAKNTPSEASDVDLVLDGDDLSEAYWDILFALEDRLSVPVDVLTMRGLDGSILKESVLEGGVTLYEA
jgi:predicted nucleotidyltransferase